MRKQRFIQTTSVLAAAILLMSSCKKAPSFKYNEEEVVKQDIITSVTATGTIEPVTSVDVGTQVSGIVSKLYVDYNSTVKAGQVIAELDRTNLTSELSSAKANLTSAESSLAYQKANHERFKNLYDKGLISANDYEQARLAYVQAQQTVNKIAKDLSDMRVIAKVDEADIGEVKEGQRVMFNVDAFPNDSFTGTVTQVRQQATTESNVVTYEVVIGAPNEDLKLKPGLTANVTIYTMERKDVLAVPSKALHFKPSEAMLNDGETITDCDTPKKVWTKEGPNIKAIAVETGITNGFLTEITSGIKAGTKIITDVETSMPNMDEADGQQNSNPFMPRPRNRNRNQQQKK